MPPRSARGTHRSAAIKHRFIKMTDAEKKYSDIINMPHHRSAKHKPMSAADRAAQFAPFAALTGFDESIGDAAESYDGATEIYSEDPENDIYKTYPDD